MKKIVFVFLSIFIGMLLVTCRQFNQKEEDNNISLSNMEDADLWAAIEDVLAPGVKVSDTRIKSDVLSEKEILIKAAKFAEERGFLQSDSLFFTSQPKLAAARIETPVFIHNFLGSAEDSYEYGAYLIFAVDENGEYLANFLLKPHDNVETSGLDIALGVMSEDILESNAEIALHFITKREAVELIESQFPGQPYEGPIAVKMEFEGEVWGNTINSWYFTVGDSESRAVGGTYDEYLIDTSVYDYRNLTGGITSNRSAIDTESTAKSWGGHRMVKLETPVYFLEKLKRAQAGERSAFTGEAPSPARVIPVPLK
jgi:hypothetical protein